jgi:hypothetical protein
METRTKKTAKFYRDAIARENNVSTLNALIKDVVTKYGKDKEIRLDGTKCNWNHWVNGFAISPKGELLVSIYWQGDSTDGSDYAHFNEILNRGKYVIRAKSYWDGYRTRYYHSVINVEKYEVVELIKLLVEWLSPNAIKERKVNASISKLKNEVLNKIENEYFSKYSRKFGNNEEYYNGKGAVIELLINNAKEFIKMDFDAVMVIVDKVFKKNYKTDRAIGISMMKREPYDISY